MIFELVLASAPLLLAAYLALVVWFLLRRRRITSAASRWAWLAALTTFPLVALAWTWRLVIDPSSTAVVGIYFVPLAAAVLSLLVFATVWALGTLLAGLRSRPPSGATPAARAGATRLVWAAVVLVLAVLLGSLLWVALFSDRALSRPEPAADELRTSYAVAIAPSSPPSSLESLARRPEASLRSAVAANPAVPLELLTTLAADPDARVRRVVAANARTPETTLLALAGDGDTDVRRLVATHAKTPLSALELLARDSDEKVRRYAAQRLGTPQAP